MARVTLPCPFPHEAKRGVFLEIDTEDFCFVRVSCSDCGCAGPYVSFTGDKPTKAEKAKAITAWNTRASPTSDHNPLTVKDMRHSDVVERVAGLTAEALLSHLLQIEVELTESVEDFEPGVISLQRRRVSALNHLLSSVIGGSSD